MVLLGLWVGGFGLGGPARSRRRRCQAAGDGDATEPALAEAFPPNFAHRAKLRDALGLNARMTIISRCSPLTLTTLALATSCYEPAPTQDEKLGTLTQAVTLGETHLYLRCNATGWAISEATRLKPSVDGRIATLDFLVTAPWMTQSGDQCVITETNQLNGWGTSPVSWTVAGSQPFVAPNTHRLSESWTPVVVKYPALGTYRAVVDRSIGTLTVSKPGTWSWPWVGEYGSDWTLGGYVDRDPSGGFVDYAGGDRTYDGHTGSDMGVANFRAMDAGLQIAAAQAGTVVEVVDEHFDRVIHADDEVCGNETNVITIETADGYFVDYGHIKQHSALVQEGESVSQGQPVAVVGSAGCSSGPHLHFEIRDPNGTAVDPFQLGYWADPLPYVAPLSVMDVVLKQGQFAEDEAIDPAPNPGSLPPGAMVSLAVTVAGGDVGDLLTFRLRQPDGLLQSDGYQIEFDSPSGQSIWVWGFDLGQQLGTWQFEFVGDDELIGTYPFEVE